ncbi:hypothetical protein [Kistimonas asteriae]|uniref:hypothetical protein n=1 Tax=Kistimonas asteriae TaxID=517724 RepID=UPI001BA687E9|nr:hypothetical protein [Kistimonas asteriae]
MSKIEIPQEMLHKLGPAMAMDVHWIDVKLKNGKTYYRLVVRGSRYITGFHTDKDGIGRIPFSSKDIKNIRRQSAFKCYPFW